MRKQYDTTFVRDAFALVRDLDGLQAAVNQRCEPAAICPHRLVCGLDLLVFRYNALEERRQGLSRAETRLTDREMGYRRF